MLNPVRLIFVLAVAVLLPASFRDPIVANATSTETEHEIAIQCPGDNFVGIHGSLPNWNYAKCNKSTTMDAIWVLHDIDGGSLMDGDEISLGKIITPAETFLSTYLGNPLRLYEDDGDADDARFLLWSGECSNCQVPEGLIYIQSVDTGKYWSAAGCGGGDVNANKTSPSTYCERFEIEFH